MRLALDEAHLALNEQEVPVGAVVVFDNQVMSKAHNQRQQTHHISQHAEIIALEAAATSAHSWKLDGATLYVTLEPCLMCLGAILQSRVSCLCVAGTKVWGSCFNAECPKIKQPTELDCG